MANTSGAVNRPAHNAPVLVIGLGRFGASTAEQLVKQGREVLAIERDRTLVQKWAGAPDPRGGGRRHQHRRAAPARRAGVQLRRGGRRHLDRVLGADHRQPGGPRHRTPLGQGHHALARQDPHPHRRQPRDLPGGRRRRPRRAPGVRPDAGLHRVRRRLRDREDVPADARRVGFTLDESKVRSKYGVTIVGVKSPGEDFTYARPETKVSAGTC